MIDGNLSCEESGTDSSQNVARATGRQTGGAGGVVGHRLTRLTNQRPRTLQEQRHWKLGRELSDYLDAAFAGGGP